MASLEGLTSFIVPELFIVFRFDLKILLEGYFYVAP